MEQIGAPLLTMLVLPAILSVLLTSRSAAAADTFKVGVVDQVVVHTWNATTRTEALRAIMENLDTMNTYAQKANQEVCMQLEQSRFLNLRCCCPSISGMVTKTRSADG